MHHQILNIFLGFIWQDPDDNSISNERFRGRNNGRLRTSTVRIPGDATTRSPCEDACIATTQFDPICGTNGVTYTNAAWLRCAQRCGRSEYLNKITLLVYNTDLSFDFNLNLLLTFNFHFNYLIIFTHSLQSLLGIYSVLFRARALSNFLYFSGMSL